jgi:hypothetical protein
MPPLETSTTLTWRPWKEIEQAAERKKENYLILCDKWAIFILWKFAFELLWWGEGFALASHFERLKTSNIGSRLGKAFHMGGCSPGAHILSRAPPNGIANEAVRPAGRPPLFQPAILFRCPICGWIRSAAASPHPYSSTNPPMSEREREWELPLQSAMWMPSSFI